MFAIRAQGLTRGPLNRLPKPKAGGPTVSSAFGALGAIVRGGPKKSRKDGADGQKGALGQDLLKDVSFTIDRGSIVALPGPDLRAIEALMRILTASLQVSAGRIEINGSIGGLVTVGANLEADLTGREAVIRERAYMRVPEEREEAFLDEVLAFSGMKEFEDVLIRRYSTGMSLRLGLAMILMAKPSVVVLGDIMGVGDLDFHQRCKEQIRQMASDGATFLLGGPAFAVDDLADRKMFFERGRISSDLSAAGDEEPEDGGPASHVWHVADDQVSCAVLGLSGISVLPPTHIRRSTHIRLHWRVKAAPQKIRLILDFLHGSIVVFRAVAREVIVEELCWLRATVSLPPLLGALHYRVRITCISDQDGRKRTMRIAHALDAVPTAGARSTGVESIPLLRPPLDWEIAPIEEIAD